MLDHILGKPSANVRRIQALLTTLITVLLIRRQKQAPWGLRWLVRLDQRVPIWKALLGWSTVLYLLRHMDDLLGLNAPEPLREYYSRSFYRATWIFTALDAGFWTAMTVRPRPLRHVLSILFSIYYLVFTNRGVEKVRKVRALITVDHLRVSWNKGVDNPLLRLVRRLHSSKLTVSRIVSVPDKAEQQLGESDSSSGRLSDVAELEPAKCHIMYAGDPATFASCRYIVLNYPGGGFVSMGPECHSDYLSAWAEKTGAVVVSVDYAKAPEYPYPYAIDQCYEVYREIVQTNGRCIGLSGDIPDGERLHIVFAGDSAGGNITASVMFRILESADRLPSPDGIVFIYGCFNVDIRAWMTRQETRMLLGAPDSMPLDSAYSQSSLTSLVDNRDHLHHVSPLAVTNRDDGYRKQKAVPGGSKSHDGRPVYIDDRVRVVRKPASREDTSEDSDQEDKAPTDATAADRSASKIGYVPLSMTSSFTYFNDQILSPEMMRAMIIMYVGPNGRPNFRTDYYLSPLVAPDHLLERFPPVYFMCGEKDPMVDDTVLFAARIRMAKQKALSGQRGSKARRDAGARSKSEMKAEAPHTSKLDQTDKPQQQQHEYRDYKSSILYSRRHSQPRLRSRRSNFYIGSTDVSDNDDDSNSADQWSTTGNSGGSQQLQLPASLRMSQFPSQPKPIDPTPAPTADPVIKVKIVAGMSHGFMQMYSLLPESKQVANTMAAWLAELLYGNHKITAYSRCASVVESGNVETSGKPVKIVEPLSDAETDDEEEVEPVESKVLGFGQSIGKQLIGRGGSRLHYDRHRHRHADGTSSVDEIETGNGITIRITSPPPPLTLSSGSPATSGSPPSQTKGIFDKGQIDKHGIEIVTAANMVRRRGHGLADPLN
ncbi:hypothetical protein LPJ53_003295 [Coemansia erecta]|uniref:Alpha/beta hydrolase fold-3 domain-containing protein n=1 Tax=Coemansia erecta TaxID=147472 RepID=A0A9W7Y1N1_9FUNG|nr:hypothetical protein LPJ53_003295 [Coemansia erecta]